LLLYSSYLPLGVPYWTVIHINRIASITRQLPGPPLGQPAEGQGNQNRERQPAPAASDYPKEANVDQYHVFITQKEDKRDDLWYEAKVNAVAPLEPQYMHWSKASITWGREDHPPLIPRPRGYALVLNPIVFSDTHTCRFSHVLINRGSSSNLLYHTSMEKLGIPAAQLKPNKLTFHGISRVPPWEGFSWRCCLERRAISAASPSGSRW
jgi:hypothetical protein